MLYLNIVTKTNIYKQVALSRKDFKIIVNIIATVEEVSRIVIAENKYNVHYMIPIEINNRALTMPGDI